MKRKYIILIVCLLAILCPAIYYAQQLAGIDVLYYSKLNQFISGSGTFEDWFMQVFTKLDTQINDSASAASMLGRSIGALGALMYLSYLGWQMQNGERNWDVTPMIRPIVIGLILINWTSFCSLIQYPLQKLAEPSSAMFADIEKDTAALRDQRFLKQSQLIDALIKDKADNEAKQTTTDNMQQDADKGWFDAGMDKLLAPIKEYTLRMEFGLQKLISNAIEAIALGILRICTYLIFFIQKIWAYILIILGPIAIGISLIPGFESSFGHWVSKFININLYTFIAYTIINIGQQLIMAGYQMEIDRLDLMLNNGNPDMGLIAAYLTADGMLYTVLFPVVAYLVTAIGILLTPSIADSIVTSGSAGIMSKASGITKVAVKSIL